MSYTVQNSAGTTVVVVPDRYIDRETTSVALVGYNATSYGLDHAENFLHLMEHFANDVAPIAPVTGQLWFDTSTNIMKCYHGGEWAEISGDNTVGDDPTAGGIAGVYHCEIPADATSVLIMLAGDNIVAVVACKDIVQAHLPASVTISTTDYAFQSVFPYGLQAGVNLADANGVDEPTDYVFSGRVPLAENAHFAGGGANDAEISGWGYIDIGPGKSVGLMISNGQVVAAVASAYVLNSDLPVSAVFNINTNRVDDPVTVQVKARFPGSDFKQWTVDPTTGVPTYNPALTIANVALFPGLTFANVVSNTSQLNQTIYALSAANTSAIGTAIASATESIEVWVDANSATALKLTDLEATFQSATGTTSISSAVQSLIAIATDTSATTTAITNLQSQFTTALGASSFGEALNTLTTTASAAGTASQEITSLTASITNQFGGTTVAQALSNLTASVNAAGQSITGYGLTLNSNGYVTGIQALNGGASNNYFKVTTSSFIIGDNNIDFIPFQVTNGVVTMHSVEVDTLKVNTAIIPVRASSSGINYGTYGSTSGTPAIDQNLISVVIHMPVPGYIEVNFTCRQGFTANGPWEFMTYVNGNALPETLTGGTVPGDNINTMGSYFAATAGDYTCTVLWEARTTIQIDQRAIFVKGYPSTA